MEKSGKQKSTGPPPAPTNGETTGKKKQRNRRRPKKKARVEGDDAPASEESSSKKKAMDVEKKPAKPQQQQKSSTHQFSAKKFDDVDALSSQSKKALREVMKFECMTKVQAETLDPILSGIDVLARAKTGSGKTVSFLLPTIECLVNGPKPTKKNFDIGCLVLSPTRELSMQIAAEVASLTTYHSLKCVCQIGGTKIGGDARKLKSKVDIIVATPGRFLDHLGQNTEGIVEKLQNLKVLIFDEADRLLDMGFRDSITKILSYLPNDRQTLLFSATLPKSLMEITKVAMKSSYKFVDTLEEGEENTNVQVTQEFVVTSIDDQFQHVESIIRSHMAELQNEYKIIVFFNTARTAGFMAELFAALGFPILEMHSRKSQAFRTKVAAQFSSGSKLIMFSSDVSARGVDYEGVSMVLQVGLTDKDQYVHRLGRTARAGRRGKGVLLLQEFEQGFLRELSDFKLQRVTNSSTSSQTDFPKVVQENRALRKSAKMAYQAYLGYYNSNVRRLGINKTKLVIIANSFATALGFEESPALLAKTVGKMGLKGTPGLRIEKPGQGDFGGGRGGRGGRGGGRGRGRGRGFRN